MKGDKKMPDTDGCPGGPDFYRDVKEALFDKKTGLVYCIGRKVPKSWLWTFITIFFLSCLGTGYKLFFKVDSASMVFADQRENATEHHNMKMDIANNEKELEIHTEAIRANAETIGKMKIEIANTITTAIEKQTTVIIDAINNKKEGENLK